MRFLANVLFAACLSVVALSLEAAAEGRVEKGELYTLYHDPSDLILDTSVRPVWLDDSRLMFRANGLVKKKEAFFKGKTKLYIWTIGGGLNFIMILPMSVLSVPRLFQGFVLVTSVGIFIDSNQQTQMKSPISMDLWGGRRLRRAQDPLLGEW